MKKAFTLLELIFVIVLIGVLSGIAFYMNRPDPTRSDAQYALLKLKEARYRAIGYDELQQENCVDLNEAALETDNGTVQHKIKSIIDRNNTICFDALGRPHVGYSIDLSTLFHISIDIAFIDPANSEKNTTIRLFPQSGYATITCPIK
jgi:prepilin-type N-terminal cleavage/methylation domain-containing protein